MADMSSSLRLAAFARDRDNKVFLYLKEDVHSIKVHVESLTPTTLDRMNLDLEAFQKDVIGEIDKMTRFSKRFNYKISTINAIVSLNYSEISKAQQKWFRQRLVEGLKTTSLVGKASGVIGTGIAVNWLLKT